MTPCCLARGLLLVTSVTEKDVVAGAPVGKKVKLSCSKGGTRCDRLQTNNAGTVHKQKAYWYRCPEGLSSPVPHGNNVSPLCCRGLKQDTARGPAGENHRISENCIRDASSRCSDGALQTRQKQNNNIATGQNTPGALLLRALWTLGNYGPWP